jgi:ArsR family transcriptional regulator
MAASRDPDIRLLQALADPIRLTIVRELAGQPEVCACDFKVLREAGVIEGERRGTWIFYRLQPEAATRLKRISSMLSEGAAGVAGAGTSRPAAGRRMLPVLPA